MGPTWSSLGFSTPLQKVSFYGRKIKTLMLRMGLSGATLGLENPVDFSSEESYLEIIVENVPLSPRQALTSVLYSMKSDTANYSQEAIIPILTIYLIYLCMQIKTHFQIFH